MYYVKFYMGKDLGWLALTECFPGEDPKPLLFDTEDEADAYVSKMSFDNNKLCYEVDEWK